LPINPATGREGLPVADVFGGEKQTPHSVFDKRRREGGWTPERPNGTVVANHRANDLAMECPDCHAAGHEGVRMFADQRGYYCVGGGHIWKDYDLLMARQPKKMAYKGIVARQEGFVKMTIEMPGSIAEAIQKKFGDKLSATLTGVMDILSGEKCIMIGETDVKRLQGMMAEEVKSAGFIVGKMYELKEKVTEQEQTIEKLRENLKSRMTGRKEPVNDTTMILDLGEMSEALLQKAQEKEWTPDMYVLEAVRLAIEGNWV